MERRQWVGLAKRAGEGDKEAFGELVELFKKPLCAVIHPLVHDWHLAQDVAQESLASIYELLPTMWTPELFRAWLYRIARNRAVTKYRRRERRRTLTMEAAERQPIRGVLRAAEFRRKALPPGEGLSSTAVARVLSVLGRLPHGYGSVLVMRYLEEMSVPEIAEVLERTPKATRSILYRARILARDQLLRAGLDFERIRNEM